DNGVVMVETKCHDPTQLLKGEMMDDYNSSDCVLTVGNVNTQNLRLCTCTGHDCNELVLLNKPNDGSGLVI
ncbi:hypothetical protein M9458_039013, partial [Cirrhinus mrigala]